MPEAHQTTLIGYVIGTVVASGLLSLIISLFVAPAAARKHADALRDAGLKQALRTEQFRARLDLLMHPVTDFWRFADELDGILYHSYSPVSPDEIDGLRLRIGNSVHRIAQFEDRAKLSPLVKLFDKAMQELKAQIKSVHETLRGRRWIDGELGDSWRLCCTHLNCLHHLVTWAAERRIEELTEKPDKDLPDRFHKIAMEVLDTDPPA